MTTHGGLKAAAQRVERRAARAEKDLRNARELLAAAEPWRQSVLHQVDGKPTLGEVMDASALMGVYDTWRRVTE